MCFFLQGDLRGEGGEDGQGGEEEEGGWRGLRGAENLGFDLSSNSNSSSGGEEELI